MSKIILGSGSPRRRELLAKIGITEFTVSTPEVEECYPDTLSPAQIVCHLSAIKSRAIESGAEDIPAKVIRQDGGVEDLLLHVKGLTADEKEIILDGCLMNYYAKRVD